jgi:hypothetical protein
MAAFSTLANRLKYSDNFSFPTMLKVHYSRAAQRDLDAIPLAAVRLLQPPDTQKTSPLS